MKYYAIEPKQCRIHYLDRDNILKEIVFASDEKIIIVEVETGESYKAIIQQSISE